MKPEIDIAAIGYPVVREAFDETLALCVDKLSKSEIRLAEERLDVGPFDEDILGIEEMLKDTALYSRKDRPGKRLAKRAIDRVTEKLLHLRDPLKSAIAARLPAANFSIFRLEGAPETGIVRAQDVLDNGRAITIMDNSLAATVAEGGERFVAGRFLDLGPWHIGFGIVRPLRKSEVVAVSLSLAGEEHRDNRRDDLHELLYATHIHQENLVMVALEPMIAALAIAIDEGMIAADDIMAGFGSLLADEGDDENQPDRIAP